jgi:hypothetical protein
MATDVRIPLTGEQKAKITTVIEKGKVEDSSNTEKRDGPGV